jgi:hypothetical protein
MKNLILERRIGDVRALATHKAENVISCVFGRSSSSCTTSFYSLDWPIIHKHEWAQ